jgi:hypothetical protein
LFDAGGTDIPKATGITAITEIFASGTALYFMVIGQILGRTFVKLKINKRSRN